MRGIKSGKLIREYKLLAGGHIQADPLWKPSAEEIKDAQDRGTSPRAPIQNFTAPAIVKSDKDLVALFPEKFQYMTDPRQPKQVGTTQEDTPTEASKEAPVETPQKSVVDIVLGTPTDSKPQVKNKTK